MSAIDDIKTFSEARDYLESLIPKYKVKYPLIGLERIRLLLQEMGNPQDSYPTIHIGGTAGKTSTTIMTAAILQKAGYKTGLHISPHLQDIRERAQINGELMPEKEFVDMTIMMKKYADLIDEKYDYGLPTYFEVLVALAFQHFKQKKVDVAIIEVGLGGTHDGTNVLMPKVAVLTNVGLDHTEILGDTIEKIASDKVGIFKEGIDVVSGVTQPSVVKIVEVRAKKMHCRLNLLGRDIKYLIKDESVSGGIFDIQIGEEGYSDVEIAAVGEYQVSNACLAMDAALKLRKHGFDISESDVRGALKSLNIPGRFEILGDGKTIILDGAHSPMKIEALVSALEQNYPRKKIRFIFAVKIDKDSPSMLKVLSKISSKFYFTRFSVTTDFGKRMSHDPKDLQSLTGVVSEVFYDPYDAYRKASGEMKKGDILCITGSLYLVGELRERLIAATS